MKTFIINTIAVIAFYIQLFSFVLNVFCMKAPEDDMDVLWNYFVIILYSCSVIAVIIFILFYNFEFKFLKNRILDSLILLVVASGGYIHIWQIAVQRDFIISSCLLALFDIYIIRKIIQNFGWIKRDSK